MARSLHVPLHQKTYAVRATVTVADGVNPVRITNAHLPRFGWTPTDPGPNARIPRARLPQSLQIIRDRTGRNEAQCPAVSAIERKQIVRPKQNEPFGADFLKIVSGQA